jgi:hypothetical protein
VVDVEAHAIAPLDRRHRTGLLAPRQRDEQRVPRGDRRDRGQQEADAARDDRVGQQAPQAVQEDRARLELGQRRARARVRHQAPDPGGGLPPAPEIRAGHRGERPPGDREDPEAQVTPSAGADHRHESERAGRGREE